MLAIYSLLYPRSHYYGEVKPENLVFNANIQEFAQRVSYISCLASNGKISMEQAFSDIEALWKELEKTKQELGIGENPFSGETEAD
ncbi:hypothetical protein ACE1CD_34225 [Aerosakkonema sp. BLCC-F183]|uniref:DUF7219 family protein n=1 Tax=Aerosakkonema sp. BLCC-F183 TaxID=3342834 RepID=UPI0035B94E0E